MLRVSAMTTDTEIDLQAINGDAEGAAVGIEYGAELMHFAQSVASGTPEDLRRTREALLGAAGGAGFGGCRRRCCQFPAHGSYCGRGGNPGRRHDRRSGSAGT